MKKTKLPLLILPLSLFTLVGCNKAKYNIGSCQLIKHEALDAATKGFMDAVKEQMPEMKFDLQNAAGDSATCLTIANSFKNKNVKLIMANATPALQAAARLSSKVRRPRGSRSPRRI